MPPAPEEKPALPKTSVLIVAFNCADALRRCLTSLERSTNREAFEVIVVDNGSRDATPQLEPEFPAVTFLKLPRHFGLAKARNIGTRTATGECLLLLNPCVELEPQTVASLAETLHANPQTPAVTAAIEPPQPNYPLPSADDLARLCATGDYPPPKPPDAEIDWVPALALLVRKEFVRGMNYFDERLANHWGDLELCWQIRHAGKRILPVPSARAAFHPHSLDLPPDARAAVSADMALAAAAYIAKHQGTAAGLAFRLKAMLGSTGGALGAIVRARDLRYHTSRWLNLLTGQRIDGSQSSI
ncbi:MAG: glycosyltransferase [Bryobacteraceae bacterium]|nr:glycosyltransferase [Bryobacteraceae bacterium]